MKRIKGVIIPLFAILLLMTLVSASDFKIENSSTNLLTLGGTGDLNITSGWIAEGGVQLANKYCALTGCTFSGGVSVGALTVTTSLDATGATLTLDANSVDESDIDFTTTCGSGNRLYISGGNLACEAASSGINEATARLAALSNVTGQTGVNWTYNVGSNDATVQFDCSEVEGVGIDCSGEAITLDNSGNWAGTWQSSSPTDYVAVTGDTMTGTLTMQNTIDISHASAEITDGTSDIDIDGSGNVVITLG